MANRVEPIRDKNKIRQIKKLMMDEGKWRDYVFFVCGINFGLRIGDLLRIKVEHIIDIDGSIRETFEIVEQKTKKRNFIVINYEAEDALSKLFQNTDILDQHQNHIIYNSLKPYKKITRIQAYKIIRSWCNRVGITGISIGTHTLRKTWGYHAHKAGVSIEVIQAKYMHHNTETTRHYLGIERKDIHEAYDKVNL